MVTHLQSDLWPSLGFPSHRQSHPPAPAEEKLFLHGPSLGNADANRWTVNALGIQGCETKPSLLAIIPPVDVDGGALGGRELQDAVVGRDFLVALNERREEKAEDGCQLIIRLIEVRTLALRDTAA
jgi:hypothetical protein